MTKHELAQQVAANGDLTGEKAKERCRRRVWRDRRRAGRGRDVVIADVGKFSVSECAARDGRNPATGETIQIAASRAAKFSAAAALKQQLDG
jgi:DNA-binding protein HU-beta